MNHKYQLYSYWRSSASWRIRWALNLKKQAYESVYVNLLKGENQSSDYLSKNPSGLLPLLITKDGKKLGQSMAILQFLELEHPEPVLMGSTHWEKAKILEFAETINADTSPIQTPRVQKKHSSDENERKAWAQHFIHQGLNVCQNLINHENSVYAFTPQPSIADIFLIPQIYNALRYEVPVEKDFPKLFKIYQLAMTTTECKEAAPAAQLDAQK